MLTWIQVERMLRAVPEGDVYLTLLADPDFDADDPFPLRDSVYLTYTYDNKFVMLRKHPVRVLLLKKVNRFLQSKGFRILVLEADDSGMHVEICKLQVTASVDSYKDLISKLSISELAQYDWDKQAFGFSQDAELDVPVADLVIQYTGDLESAADDLKQVGGGKKFFKKPLNKLPPIDVAFSGGKFLIEDGHHRYLYAKELGVPSVKVKVDIKDNPFDVLGFDFDDIVALKKSLQVTAKKKVQDILTKKDITELSKQYAYFHISDRDLGEEFLFTPRTPRAPYEDDNGDVIEDDFTPRVSLASSVKDAESALSGSSIGCTLYGAKSNVSTLEPRNTKVPGGGKAKSLKMRTWLKHMSSSKNPKEAEEAKNFLKSNSGRIFPKNLPPILRKYWYGFVPDAADTKEYWALKPVRLMRLGYF